MPFAQQGDRCFSLEVCSPSAQSWREGMVSKKTKYLIFHEHHAEYGEVEDKLGAIFIFIQFHFRSSQMVDASGNGERFQRRRRGILTVLFPAPDNRNSQGSVDGVALLPLGRRGTSGQPEGC